MMPPLFVGLDRRTEWLGPLGTLLDYHLGSVTLADENRIEKTCPDLAALDSATLAKNQWIDDTSVADFATDS